MRPKNNRKRASRRHTQHPTNHPSTHSHSCIDAPEAERVSWRDSVRLSFQRRFSDHRREESPSECPSIFHHSVEPHLTFLQTSTNNYHNYVETSFGQPANFVLRSSNADKDVTHSGGNTLVPLCLRTTSAPSSPLRKLDHSANWLHRSHQQPYVATDNYVRY